MKLYIAFTSDKYEIPLVVEESLEEFCRKLGITKEYCWNAMARDKGGSRRGYRIMRINVDSENE